MNTTQYDYIPQHLPNVVLKRNKADQSPAPVVALTPAWLTLLNTLAMKKPNWTIVYDHVYGNELRKVDVFEQGEKLGRIELNEYRSGKPFMVSGPRMKMKFARNGGAITKDPKKAAKHALTYFSRRTLQEMLVKAADTAKGMASRVHQQTMSEEQTAHSTVLRHITKYMQENWPVIEEAALKDLGSTTNTTAETIRGYPKKSEALSQASVMVANVGANKGNVVAIRDGAYNVCDLNGVLQAVYVDDALPPYYKRAIGMLKLVEPGGFVPGYGVRALDNVFLVCEEEK